MKKIILGLAFILAAAFFLFKDAIQLPALDVPLWILICSAVFIIGAITNLRKKDMRGFFGSLGILLIILNAYYNWLPIGTGSLIIAFILILVGIQLLFGKEDGEK